MDDKLLVTDENCRKRSFVRIMETMIPELVELAVKIVRFIDSDQPGIVECEFIDAEGYRHTLIEKVPIVSLDDLDADSARRPAWSPFSGSRSSAWTISTPTAIIRNLALLGAWY